MTEPRGLVLVNPPDGARLEEEGTLGPLYGELGRALIEHFPDWDAGVFTGNPPLGRALRLRAYRSHTFFNGPIECRLLRFELNADAVEPDADTARRDRLEAASARPGATMFANRLKNFSRLESWARREDVACYRVYDADMPEYSFAVDIYGNDERYACVQEYAAPPTVSRDAARSRRDEALSVLPEVLGLPSERIALRVRRRQRHGEQYEKVDSEQSFHVVREGGTSSWSISRITSTQACSSTTASRGGASANWRRGDDSSTCSRTRGRRLSTPPGAERRVRRRWTCRTRTSTGRSATSR